MSLEEAASAGLWSPKWQQRLTLPLELLRAESYSLGALTGKEIPVAVLPLSLCTSQQQSLGFLAGQGFFLVHPELRRPDLFRLFPHLTLVLSLGLNFRV